MRTSLFLLAGALLMASMFIVAKLFSPHYPAATTWATGAFVAIWLALTGFNMWVGVARAGYSAAEEWPVLLILFGIPAAVALLLRWKLL